jgi:hypothetical protein
MGGMGGIQPQQVGTGGSMGRYVVRGVVRDEQGEPVEGAALAIGSEVLFTNSAGEFFLRVRNPKQYELEVRLDEFLFPGHWEVLSAPAQCRAQAEGSAQVTEVILRRQKVSRPAPAPPAPTIAPTVAPPPPQTADTFYRIDRR